jgi:hypothetical protein
MAKTATKPRPKAALRELTPKKGKERLQLWEQARGMWKHRKPDPIRELQKMRKEWERNLG